MKSKLTLLLTALLFVSAAVAADYTPVFRKKIARVGRVETKPYNHKVGGEYKTLIRPVDMHKLLVTFDTDYKNRYRDRTIYYFDTKDHELYDIGVVLRLRNNSGRLESTVKLLPAPEVSYEIFKTDKGFKLEADMGLEDAQVNASLTSDLAYCNEFKPKSCFTQKQLEFLEATVENLNWDELKPYGPVKAKVWSFRHDDLGRVTLEYWNTPKMNHLFEMSGKVKDSDELPRLRMKFLKFIMQNKIRTDDETSKTKYVLTETQKEVRH